MPEPKKYLDYVGLTEYTSLLKDYISDQQHTIDGYYDVTTTHKFYKNYDAGTFSNEIIGALGNIYVDLLTNKLYKYDNNAYIEITTSVSTNFENSGVSAGTVTINGTSSTIKVPTGDTSSTVAVGNHTHNTTIATDSGTSTVDMSANTTYKLTAGGTNVIFKTPIDTTYVFDGTYDASTNKAATVATVTNAISELPEPMVFKGSLGTGGTITTLPTASSSNKGYVYKVITAGTYASQFAKVGDTFISDGSAWVLIPSGDEPSGTVTNVAVANGGGLTVSGSPITSSGTITVGHSNSVTAKTSSSVKKFTYDAYGHVTGSSELSTAESDALASGIDSTKVAQIETNKNNISSLDVEVDTVANLGAKNLLDFNQWASKVPVYNGTKSYSNGVMTVTATGSGCVTYHNQYFPEALRIPVKEGEKYTITWDTTATTNIGFFQLCPNGNAISGTDVSIADKQTEYTVASGVTYLTYRVGVWASENSINISKLMLRPATISDSTYQPYAISNAELTAKEQQNKNNISYNTAMGVKNVASLKTSVSTGNADVTFVQNADKSYTLSISATTSAAVAFDISETFKLNPSIQYVLSGNPSSGAIRLVFAEGTAPFSWINQQYGNNPVTITPVADKMYKLSLFIYANTSATTLTLKPMVCAKSLYNSDTTYQPYAMSNAELTAKEQQNEDNISSVTKDIYLADVYDSNELIEGKIIDYRDGSEASSQYTSQYACTDYIPISQGDIINLAFVRGTNLCGGAVYDSNKQYIKTIWGTNNWQRPNIDLNAPFNFVANGEIAYLRYNVQTNSIFSRNKQYIKVIKAPILSELTKELNVITVGDNGIFTTLKSCCDYIKDNNIIGAKVYVQAGTYDLVTEFDTDYLDNITSDANIGYGLYIGNNTHFVFAENAKVKFIYDGANSKAAEHFSPFNVYGSCILENANVEVTNARYCVHEDVPTTSIYPDEYTVKYINCVMRHNGATVSTGSHTGYACIGAGVNKNSLSIIDGGIYSGSWTADISYHNYNSSAPSRLIVRNVYMTTGLRLQDFGSNTVDTEITGCYMPTLTGTYTKFNVKSWNNVNS